MNLEQFLSDIKFEKQFAKLKKRLRGKTVVIYGSGQLFQLVKEKYDLSDINIIAISDGKYTSEDRGNEFLGYKTVPAADIADLKPDYVVVAILNYTEIVYNFGHNTFSNLKTKFIPLAQKKFMTILKEIWRY